MKKISIISLLLTGVLLASCGTLKNTDIDDSTSDNEQQNHDNELLQIHEKTYTGNSSNSVGGTLKITSGYTNGVLSDKVTFKIELNEGFELYYLKINDEVMPKETLEFSPIEGVNKINVGYKKVGVNVANVRTINFKLLDSDIEKNISSLSDTDEHKAILKSHYFNDSIFNITDKNFEAENIFGVSTSNKDKHLNYVQIGGSKYNGFIKVELDKTMFTYIEKIEAEVFPYTGYVVQDPETMHGVPGFVQDKASITLDGSNYKDVPFTSGSNNMNTKSTTILFDDSYCANLNNKLHIANNEGLIEEERTERHRLCLKELRFYTVL